MIRIDNSTPQYKQLGASFLIEGKYEKSDKVERQAIKLKSDNPWVNCNLGRSLLYQGKIRESIPYLQSAIKLEPKMAEAYYNLGYAFTKQNSFEEAVRNYNKAIDLKPDNFLYYHHLGDVFFIQKQYKEAIKYYDKAIKLNSEYAWSYYNLGKALSELRKWEEAIAAYKKAIEIEPNLPAVHENLGEALMQERLNQNVNPNQQSQSQYSNLNNHHGKAASQKSHLIQNYLNLGNAKLKESQFVEALDFYKKAVEAQPGCEEVHQKLGNTFVKLKHWEEAVTSYNRSIQLKPNHETYHLLAVPLEKLRRWDALVTTYLHAINLNPNYYLYHHRLGNFYHKTGAIEKAIASYNRAIELNPKYAWVHYHLGDTLEHKGDLQGSISAYEKALQLEPNLSRASQALEKVKAKQRRIEAQKVGNQRTIQIQNSKPIAVNSNQEQKGTIKIVFYPRFNNEATYTDQFYRMLWYLNPLVDRIDKITIPVGFEDINPGPCPDYIDRKSAEFYSNFSGKLNFSFPDKVEKLIQEIDIATFVLRWNMEPTENQYYNDPIVDILKSKNIWKVDHLKERYAGSFYLKCVVESDDQYEKNIEESQEKFFELAELMRSEQGFIFGTGPSLSQAYNFRFDNCETITCNSMVKNRTLMEYLKPKVIVASDPIFHAGCSSYAADFRRYLCEAIDYFKSYFVVPMRDYHIYKSNLDDNLRHRLIGIPLKTHPQPNLNLLDEFWVTSTGNVLTLYMFPLATTLFEKIGIMGCDGRPLQDDKYFWSHDASSQFVNKMGAIQDAHGAFFAIDYNEYYLTHCETLKKWLVAAEAKGKEIQNFTPSYIPALQERSSTLQDSSPLPSWINVNGIPSQVEPLVSIIMPARNAAETISESIKSVQDEELQEWELIVINDGSADDTKAVVEEIGQIDRRIAIYDIAGMGVSFARNVGLSVARGQYIAFLDADDLYQNQALTKRVKALETNPDWDGVYCLTQVVNDQLHQLGWLVGAYGRPITFLDMHGNIHLGSVVGKAELFRRQSFKVGLANGEDWLYLSQVLRSGAELKYIEDCNVVYRIHERSTVLQDFVGHQNKLLEVIDILYGVDTNCTQPASKYEFGLDSPDKNVLILKRQISMLTFLLLARKGRIFYESAQKSSNLSWEKLKSSMIIGNIKTTTMRYYACSSESWVQKLQENSTYIMQVFAEFKAKSLIPLFCQNMLDYLQQK